MLLSCKPEMCQVKRPEAAKNDEEYDLEQKLNFEAYRDLISLLKRKIPEEKVWHVFPFCGGSGYLSTVTGH